MSKEWFEAAERMLAAEMKNIDVVIGTALIPGRAAPRLITEVGATCTKLRVKSRPTMFVSVPSVGAGVGVTPNRCNAKSIYGANVDGNADVACYGRTKGVDSSWNVKEGFERGAVVFW